MIDFNKLTTQAQNTILAANDVMQRYQNSQLDPIHLLLASVEDNTTVVHDILQELKINSDNFKEDVEKAVNSLPKITYSQTGGQLYLSNDFHSMYEKASEIASTMKDSFISLEHFLLAMSEMSNNLVSEVLKKNNIQKIVY